MKINEGENFPRQRVEQLIRESLISHIVPGVVTIIATFYALSQWYWLPAKSIIHLATIAVAGPIALIILFTFSATKLPEIILAWGGWKAELKVRKILLKLPEAEEGEIWFNYTGQDAGHGDIDALVIYKQKIILIETKAIGVMDDNKIADHLRHLKRKNMLMKQIFIKAAKENKIPAGIKTPHPILVIDNGKLKSSEETIMRPEELIQYVLDLPPNLSPEQEQAAKVLIKDQSIEWSKYD